MIQLLSGVTTLEVIASRHKNIMNNEDIKGKEDENVFSGSRIQHFSFPDFKILFRGCHPLQTAKYKFHIHHEQNPYFSDILNQIVFVLYLKSVDLRISFFYVFFLTSTKQSLFLNCINIFHVYNYSAEN